MIKENINNLKLGDKLENKDICTIFKCAPQGGMRRSLKTNTLVLVCDHTKSLYEDRWEEEILFYTGMGTKGDQSFLNSQNKTLYQSKKTAIDVYLFEVFKSKEYTFMGKVCLAAEPFMEQQLDLEGKERKVCVFPLRLLEGKRELTLADIEAWESMKQKLVRRLSNEEVFEKALKINGKPSIVTVNSRNFNRNIYVSEHAKRRAMGKCELCENPAPFRDKKGQPYLESHHIVWLSKGGADSIDNTVALCPNCHVKMHIVNDVKDVGFLKNKALIK